MLAGHVAGDRVGDDGGVGGGEPVAPGYVADGELGLLHAHERLGFFGGPAGQVVCCLALSGGGGMDPVVCQDAEPVAKIEDGFGITSFLGNAAAVTPINTIWKP